MEFLVDRLIPANSYTLLHGPPGAGKSAFLWGAAQAISKGEDYLGLKVSKSRPLLISTDMNAYALKARWGGADATVFVPDFDLVIMDKQDVVEPTWRLSNDAMRVADLVKTKNIGVIFFDALSGLIVGRSVKDDETATLCYQALDAWLGPVAKVINHHDRKILVGEDEPSDESFLGSQFWASSPASCIHMWRMGECHSILKHSKSQVAVKMEEKIHLYINLEGKAELWQEHRAQEVRDKTRDSLRGHRNLTAKEQVAILMREHNISERQAYRWLKLYKG